MDKVDRTLKTLDAVEARLEQLRDAVSGVRSAVAADPTWVTGGGTVNAGPIIHQPPPPPPVAGRCMLFTTFGDLAGPVEFTQIAGGFKDGFTNLGDIMNELIGVLNQPNA